MTALKQALGERSEIEAACAAALNQHDLFALREVRLRSDRVPMTRGRGSAGMTADGCELIVHTIVSDGDSDRTRSEVHPATFAQGAITRSCAG